MTDAVVEIVEGEVSSIIINRPEALNALSVEVLTRLEEGLARLESNNTVRTVVISGAGEKAFVAGADIRAMADKGQEEIAAYIELGQRVMNAIGSCRVPVIASVGGFALGGGLELALACDFIIASEKARLGLPEVSLGIIPGFGGTQRLIARAGLGTAKRIVLVGDMVSADQALSLRIVDEVVPHDQLASRVQSVAETMASRGPLALAAARNVLNSYGSEALQAGLELEVSAFIDLFGSDDRKEGMRAFLEKRTATFIGK